MSRRHGFTRRDLLAVVCAFVLAVLVVVFVVGLWALPQHNFRVGCRDNLRQLANGLTMYIDTASHRFYPCPLGRAADPDDYNGAEWLASLYWTGIVIDPTVFVCPSSGDDNHNGLDLGTHRVVAGRFGSQTVSYAAMHWRSLTDQSGRPTTGAIRDDFPPFMVMASDDTQGGINHASGMSGGMSVLFFDAHVEFRTNTEVDLARGVGQRGGVLWQLRN